MKQVPYGFVVGNNWYVVCGNCMKIVKRNKFIFGDLHYCNPTRPQEKILPKETSEKADD